MSSCIAEKTAKGKLPAARKMQFCLNKLTEFLDGEDIPLEIIDNMWVNKFSSWLTETERLTDNTRANYLRVIQNACRIAAKDGIPVNLEAFSREHTVNARAVRDLLSTEDVMKLASMDLSAENLQTKIRDHSCLSCYAEESIMPKLPMSGKLTFHMEL